MQLIARLRAFEWHKASNELPEPNIYVLVYNINGYNVAYRKRVLQGNFVEWFIFPGTYSGTQYSHWMYLEKPKE